MAYKFQVGSSKLSGSITLTNILSSSAQISASAYFGDGSGLSGIAASNAAVTDKDDDTEYSIVAVAASGDSVTLVTDDTALTKATFNPSVGRLTLPGSVTTNALTASSGLMVGTTAVTATGTELNYVDVAAIGTVEASKAVVVDANKDATGFRNVTGTTISGSTVAASTKLQIGSAEITEAEFELIDGITGGTVTASKAVVVDSEKDIGTFRDVTGSALSFTGGESALLALDIGGGYGSTGVTISSAGVIQADSTITGSAIQAGNYVSGSTLQASQRFVIGSADINESDLEQIDGITAGTAAASKAVVLDSAKNIGTIGQLSASVISGSAIYGDGSNLSGIAADHIDVTAGSSTEPSPILFAASGSVGTTSVQPLGLQPAGNSAQQFTFNPGNGNLFVPGNVEAGSGGALVIGNASLVEADMEQLDGITAGTGAASKALVLNSAADVTAGLRDLTGSAIAFASADFGGGFGSTGISIASDGDLSSDATVLASTISGSTLHSSYLFQIGSTQMTENEFSRLDSLTAGTVSASKVVVVDANKDISTFRNLTGTQLSGSQIIGSTSVLAPTISGSTVAASTHLKIGNAELTETEFEYLDGITAGAAAANKAVVLNSAADVNSGLRNVTGSALEFEGGTSGLLAVDIGGGYGSTGVTISSAGVIQADSTITGSAIEGAAYVSGSKLFASTQLGIAGVPVYGDGSNITGIASDSLLTATQTSNATYYFPFVDSSTGQSGEDVYIHDALSINPSSSIATIAQTRAALHSDPASLFGSSSVGSVWTGTGGNLGFQIGMKGLPDISPTDVTPGGLQNQIQSGFMNFGAGNFPVLRLAAGTDENANATVVLSGSMAGAAGANQFGHGVYIASTMKANKLATFAKGLVIESSENVDIVGPDDNFNISGSSMAISVDSQNGGSNSIMCEGGALFGHEGSGVADVKIFGGTSGQAGTISGSGNLYIHGEATIKGNTVIGDDNSSDTLIANVASATIHGATTINGFGTVANGLYVYGSSGSFGAALDVAGNLAVGGGYGSTGVTINSNGVIQADNTITASVLNAAQSVSGTLLLASQAMVLQQQGHIYFNGNNSSAKISSNGANTLNLAGSSIVGNADFVPDTSLASNLGSATKIFGRAYVAQITASAGITASGSVLVADGYDLAFGGDNNITFTSATTGNSGLKLADNLASAFNIHQGGNSYLKFVTTNSEEAVRADKDLQVGSTADGAQPMLDLFGGIGYGGQWTPTKNVTLTDVAYSHYLMSGTGSTKLTVTLPSAETGYAAVFKRHPSMTASCGIAAASGENIDGSTDELLLQTAGASVMLLASGSSWFIY